MRQSDKMSIDINTLSSTSSQIPVWLITLIIGLSFILIQSKWDASLIESFSMTPKEMPGVTGIANLQPALGKALLGLFGGILLLWPSYKSFQYRLTPLLFFAGYLSFCFASVLWSAEIKLTIRNLLTMMFFIAGILGTVRHLSTRQLIDSAIVIAFMFIALGLTAEIVHGTFIPLHSNYRFAGTMHPNSQGTVCAILVLATFCSLKQTEPKRHLYLAAMIIGVLFLCLTKSRSNIFGCFLIIYLTSFWKSSFRIKLLLIFMPLNFVCLAVLTASFFGFDFLEGFSGLINVGRDLDTSDIASLNNRIPLWINLKFFFLQRPLLGYGYHGFWTPDMAELFFNEFGWIIPDGHSVIVDLLLQLGIMGFLLYGLSVLCVFYWIVIDCITNGTPSGFFTFTMILLAITSGLVESDFMDPKSFGAFVTSVALFNVCIVKKEKSQ